ncbi:MAG: threonine/serine exporter family protein [Bacteroidales bacterium]|nr:threonine/serine exporter family protein [Bacteroidales bacterium]
MNFALEIIQDGFFAAVAAVGFASISNPPKSAYPWCAAIAAVGHPVRFVLMESADCHIALASLAAALAIGCLAVFSAPAAKCPAEAISFPALLPMIPGMYAYRTFQNLVLCLCCGEGEFHHYFYLTSYNLLTCIVVLLVMAIGVTLPIFVFKKISFKATRYI